MRWMRLTMRQRHEFDDMHPPSLSAVKQKTSDDTSGVLRFDDMAGTYMYVLTCLIWTPLSLCIYVLRCRVTTTHTPLGVTLLGAARAQKTLKVHTYIGGRATGEFAGREFGP